MVDQVFMECPLSIDQDAIKDIGHGWVKVIKILLDKSQQSQNHFVNT